MDQRLHLGIDGNGHLCHRLAGLAKTDEVVTVTGKLEPLGSVQVIQMPVGGIASEILVQDGEEVKAGQVVMRLDAETTQQRLSSLQESQRLKTQQLALKQTELKQYLRFNREEEKMLMRNLSYSKRFCRATRRSRRKEPPPSFSIFSN